MNTLKTAVLSFAQTYPVFGFNLFLQSSHQDAFIHYTRYTSSTGPRPAPGTRRRSV